MNHQLVAMFPQNLVHFFSSINLLVSYWYGIGHAFYWLKAYNLVANCEAEDALTTVSAMSCYAFYFT